MAKTDNLTDFLTDIADAIRDKKGTTGAINPQDFSSEIASIESGGGGSSAVTSASVSDVNFYDYDGTILHSYTKEQFLALSAMPKLPTRVGLICQGWNWTLNDAKEYVTDYGMLNIGTMYTTDDGDTRLYIRIATEGRMTVPLRWSQTVANGVGIDWGDGSDIQTFTGTGNLNTTHTYAKCGDYVIRLKVASGCTLGLGSGSSSYCVMGGTGNNNVVYCNMLQKIEIGNHITSIDTYAFRNCYSLVSVSIPSSVTSIGDNTFSYCYSLVSVSIPSSVTSIGNLAFGYCYSLASVSIPSSVTSIGNNILYGCYSLKSISIPSSVTSIGNYMFSNCTSIKSISIPSSVTSIGNYAFQYCYSLELVSIPNGITNIGDRVFCDCYSLKSISIPSSVTSIGDYAFFRCYALSSISIPSSVTGIGNYAFQDCQGMAIYDFTKHTSVPTLSNSNAFQNISSDCIIKVPASLLGEWKAATNWSKYANKIVGV